MCCYTLLRTPCANPVLSHADPLSVVDLAMAGALEPLDKWVAADADFHWADVLRCVKACHGLMMSSLL